MVVFILLLLIGIEVEGQLQAWHRQDCPLVRHLSDPLSRLVAEHFDLSHHYVESEAYKGKGLHLRIRLRKLVFRNTTNEQAIAVMKFMDRKFERQYIMVLLENCDVIKLSSDKKDDKKLFYFEVNTQYPSLDEMYASLDDAKYAAALFESSGKWTASLNPNATEVTPKTNTRKHVKQGIGWTLFAAASPVTVPVGTVGCLLWIMGGCKSISPEYDRLTPHWGAVAEPWKEGTYGTAKMVTYKFKRHKIGIKVYDGPSMLLSS